MPSDDSTDTLRLLVQRSAGGLKIERTARIFIDVRSSPFFSTVAVSYQTESF